jgi:predicted nucleic acid-binding protein
MTRLVVDASVAAKWYLPEPYSQFALDLLDPSFQLMAPDLLFSEMGNLLWKRVIREEITQREALEILLALDSVPFLIWESKGLITLALDLACGTKRTVYDCLYLAVAVETKSRLVTADLKLFNALKKGLFGEMLCWIEDIP